MLLQALTGGCFQRIFGACTQPLGSNSAFAVSPTLFWQRRVVSDGLKQNEMEVWGLIAGFAFFAGL